MGAMSPDTFAVPMPIPIRPTPVLAGLAILVWVLLGATPAAADEFRVGILVDPATSEATGPAFMEGFQLAVDQSPDVSHPPGVEGGDHLGSMDVVMVVVDDVTGSDELRAAAVDLIEREGVAIIVADVSPEGLAAIFGPVTDSGTMLIAISDTEGTEFAATPFFFNTGRGQTDSLLTDRTPGFDDAFSAAYASSPSAAATRGYLAGRLVDLSVEATDRDPSDVQALADALAVATGSAPVSPDADADAGRAAATAPPDPESSSGAGLGPVVVGAIAVLVVAAAGLGVRAARRRAP